MCWAAYEGKFFKNHEVWSGYPKETSGYMESDTIEMISIPMQ